MSCNPVRQKYKREHRPETQQLPDHLTAPTGHPNITRHPVLTPVLFPLRPLPQLPKQSVSCHTATNLQNGMQNWVLRHFVCNDCHATAAQADGWISGKKKET